MVSFFGVNVGIWGIPIIIVVVAALVFAGNRMGFTAGKKVGYDEGFHAGNKDNLATIRNALIMTPPHSFLYPESINVEERIPVQFNDFARTFLRMEWQTGVIPEGPCGKTVRIGEKDIPLLLLEPVDSIRWDK